MNENNFEEADWNTNNEPQSMSERRGPFLLVLTILSWISIGYNAITLLYSLIKGVGDLQNSATQISTIFNNQNSDIPILEDIKFQMEDMLMKSVENYYAIQLSTLVNLLIGAFAVYLMFNLKKTGYYLYILYTIVPSLISFYFFGFNFLIAITVAINLIFGIIFIILYGINAKRMTE